MKDLDKILTIKSNNINPGKGKLLISEPFLLDYYFKRSVILLAEHSEDGSFGLIINKPLSVKINEVVKDFPEFDAKVFIGGPVQNDNLFYMHTLGQELDGSEEILKGLYWGGDLNEIKEMIQIKRIRPEEIRFFIGYSGWAPRQLQDELERNSWVVGSMTALEILQINPPDLWNASLQYLGGDYKFWLNFPEDPASN